MAAAAAAASAKVLRGGCSAASSRPLLPAILQHLGSSPAAPAAGMAHTGVFRTRGFGPQGKLMKMDHKSFMSSERPLRPPPSYLALGVSSAVGLIVMTIYTFD